MRHESDLDRRPELERSGSALATIGTITNIATSERPSSGGRRATYSTS